jgi:hypothetical protein
VLANRDGRGHRAASAGNTPSTWSIWSTSSSRASRKRSRIPPLLHTENTSSSSYVKNIVSNLGHRDRSSSAPCQSNTAPCQSNTAPCQSNTVPCRQSLTARRRGSYIPHHPSSSIPHRRSDSARRHHPLNHITRLSTNSPFRISSLRNALLAASAGRASAGKGRRERGEGGQRPRAYRVTAGTPARPRRTAGGRGRVATGFW